MIASVLVWLLKTSAAVVKWSVANPWKALGVALVAKVSGDYVRKQPWAGAKLVSDMLYGAGKLYAWPAAGRLAVEATGEAGAAIVRYLSRLLGGGRGGPPISPWAVTGAPFDVGRVLRR